MPLALLSSLCWAGPQSVIETRLKLVDTGNCWIAPCIVEYFGSFKLVVKGAGMIDSKAQLQTLDPNDIISTYRRRSYFGYFGFVLF